MITRKFISEPVLQIPGVHYDLSDDTSAPKPAPPQIIYISQQEVLVIFKREQIYVH